MEKRCEYSHGGGGGSVTSYPFTVFGPKLVVEVNSLQEALINA